MLFVFFAEDNFPNSNYMSTMVFTGDNKAFDGIFHLLNTYLPAVNVQNSYSTGDSLGTSGPEATSE